MSNVQGLVSESQLQNNKNNKIDNIPLIGYF
jgi:hypothetical protein